MKKFKWASKDGQYTIFDVPIFRETKVTKEGKEFDFDSNSLLKIVSEFKQKKEAGFLPTLHKGHNHSPEDDKPTVGFLDDIRIVGKYILANFVGIPHEDFAQIQNRKFPYRSVEIYGNNCFIKSCALLSSRTPQFLDLGVLLLEEKPCNREPELFQHEEQEEEKSDMEVEDKENQKPEEAQQNMGVPSQDDLTSMVRELSSMVREILTISKQGKSENYAMNNTSSQQQDLSNQVEKEKGVAPRTLNYSDEQELNQLRKEVALLRASKEEHILVTQLGELCEKNRLNFQENLEKMNMFSSLDGKRDFLKILPTEFKEEKHVSDKVLNFQHVSKPEDKIKEELKARYKKDLNDAATAGVTRKCFRDENDYVEYYSNLMKKGN